MIKESKNKGFIHLIVTIISWVAFAILVLLAIFLAYYTLGTKLYSSKVEKFEPAVSLYTIISPSMTPNIRIYDVVVTKKVTSPKDIKVGDVITFISTSSISNGMTITHRVVEVTENENGVAYKTKGDNNLSPDNAPADYNNVIGKVLFKIPQLGRLQEFVSTKGGWLLVIVIPALFIIISDIVKVVKLSTFKNKIEEIDNNKKVKQKERYIKEENRKKEIKKRLKLNRNIYESEPIIIERSTRIMVSSSTKSRNIKTNKTNKTYKNTKVNKNNKKRRATK